MHFTCVRGHAVYLFTDSAFFQRTDRIESGEPCEGDFRIAFVNHFYSYSERLRELRVCGQEKKNDRQVSELSDPSNMNLLISKRKI